jgi:hypothetical protein
MELLEILNHNYLRLGIHSKFIDSCPIEDTNRHYRKLEEENKGTLLLEQLEYNFSVKNRALIFSKFKTSNLFFFERFERKDIDLNFDNNETKDIWLKYLSEDIALKNFYQRVFNAQDLKENEKIKHLIEYTNTEAIPRIKKIFATIYNYFELHKRILAQRKILNLESDATILKNEIKKLKWTGTAAQFGYIMQELIGKGYIEKPTGSFPKDAEIYLEHFEIDGKKSTLIKELSETQNSIANTNRALLKIAPIDKLK